MRVRVQVFLRAWFGNLTERDSAHHTSWRDADAAVATCEEAQLRGLTAPDFDAIMRKAGRTSVGALGDGHEPRMFVMLGLRLSDGAENLARIRGVGESGSLPHVDRRDEAGNNILWGTLHALHGAVEPSANGGKGEAGDAAGGEGAAPPLRCVDVQCFCCIGNKYRRARANALAKLHGLPPPLKAYCRRRVNPLCR